MILTKFSRSIFHATNRSMSEVLDGQVLAAEGHFPLEIFA
jgi:hypothetical protein